MELVTELLIYDILYEAIMQCSIVKNAHLKVIKTFPEMFTSTL